MNSATNTPSQGYMDYLRESNPTVASVIESGWNSNITDGQKNDLIAKKAALSDTFGEFLKVSAASSPRMMDFTDPLNARDAHIKVNMQKIAGMAVYDTTPEGIEGFLKEYMYNELSFFPDKVQLAVGITPLDNSPVNNGTGQYDPSISNATGTLDITYGNALIQIPWVMRDKEIIPFDTIQMGSENSVYTRENMRNILFNIKNMVDTAKVNGTPYNAQGKGQNKQALSGYVGTAKTVSPLTDGGFMWDMLNIQSLIGGNSPGVNTYAARVNDLLEKTASIRQVVVDQYKLKHDLIKLYTEPAEKLANTAYTEPEQFTIKKTAMFESLDKTIMADVQILKNGDKFMFTEKDGMNVSKVPAVIFSPLISLEGIASGRLIITQDQRFKILEPSERFMFDLKTEGDDTPIFDLKFRDFEALNPGGLYTANISGKYLLPFTVTKVENGESRSLNIRHIYHCVDINNRRFILIALSNVNDNAMVVQSKNELMAEIAKHESPKSLAWYNIILKNIPIVCVSPSTKLVSLAQGNIANMTSPKEEMFLYDGNVKLASYGSNIEVTLLNRDGSNKMYALKAQWFDKKSQRDKRLNFASIDETKLRGLLKVMGYDYVKVSEIVYRATKEGTANYEITPTNTPWLIQPELSAGRAAQSTIETMQKSFMSEDVAKKALAALAGGVIGGAAMGSAVGNFLKPMSSFASEGANESKALAEKLEKIAMVGSSPTFTKLAAVMVIKNRIDNAVKLASEGKNIEGTEILSQLIEIDPYLQKLAYDLVELKLSQTFYKNEAVSPHVINATLRHLDGLHKYALFFSAAKPLSKEGSVDGPDTDAKLERIDAGNREIKNSLAEEIDPPKPPGPPLVSEKFNSILKLTDPITNSMPGMLAGDYATGKAGKLIPKLLGKG